MQKLRNLLAAPVLAAAFTFSPPAVAAAGHLTFQDVTFSWVSSATYMDLTLSGLSSASGDWTGIQYLAAFQIGVDGLADASSTGWASYLNQLNAKGCTGGGSPNSVCFERANGDPLALTSDSLSLGIDLVGLSADPTKVHVKVAFLDQAAYDKYFCPTCGGYNAKWKKTGSLLSQTIPVPEPEIYAMMAVGMGVVGWAARRKQRKRAAA